MARPLCGSVAPAVQTSQPGCTLTRWCSNRSFISTTGSSWAKDAYAYDPQRTVSAALDHFRLKIIGYR
jgi:hypothetical protein